MTSQVNITEFVTDFSKSEANIRGYAATVKALLAGIREEASNPIKIEVTGSNRITSASANEVRAAKANIEKQAVILGKQNIPLGEDGKKLFSTRAEFAANVERARAETTARLDAEVKRSVKGEILARDNRTREQERAIVKARQHAFNLKFFRDKERVNAEGLSAATQAEIKARVERVQFTKAGTATSLSYETQVKEIRAEADRALRGGAAAKAPPLPGANFGTSITKSEQRIRADAAVEAQITALKAGVTQKEKEIAAASGRTSKLNTAQARLDAAQDPEINAINEKTAIVKLGNEARLKSRIIQEKINLIKNREAGDIEQEGRERALATVERNRVKAAQARYAVATDDASNSLVSHSAVLAELTKESLLRTVNEKRALMALDGWIEAQIEDTIATSKLATLKSLTVDAEESVLVAKAREAVSAQLAADLQATETAQTLTETDLGAVAVKAKAERIIQEEVMNRALREAIIIEGEANHLRRVEVMALADRAAPTVAAGAGVMGHVTGGQGASGVGRFLQSGAIMVLRRAIPAALLFGAAAATVKMVQTSEQLVQINVRLEAQFENLGKIGVFDKIAAGYGKINEQSRRLAVNSALDDYRRRLIAISRETGTLTVDTFKMGVQFSGLFSSLGADSNLTKYAADATRIAAEFAIVSGQKTDESFNDLVGAIKSFTTDAPGAVSLLNDLTDNMISVANATGVSAANLADFLGRVAPVAKTAGFTLKELNAIGATMLQASGVGGAGLAEQFGRIITGFSGNIGRTIARLSIDFPKLNLNIDAITAGKSNVVLSDLIKNFNKLTQAEQAQIIASIGSRREGNTLATLLQNTTTYEQALAAQTDSTGERYRQLTLILSKLTGSYRQFKAELEILGQSILNAGLAQMLIGILDAVKVLLQGLEDLGKGFGAIAHGVSAVVGTLTPFANIMRTVFPDGATKTITKILALTVALRAMTTAFVAAMAASSSARIANIGSSIASSGTFALMARSSRVAEITTAASGAQVGFQSAAAASAAVGASAATVGKFSLAMRGSILAAVGVAAAITTVTIVQKIMAASAERARKRQEALTKSLRESKSQFIAAADAVDKYIATIGLIDKTTTTVPGKPSVGGKETIDSIITNQVANLISESGGTGVLSAIAGKFAGNGGLNGFMRSALGDRAGVGSAISALRNRPGIQTALENPQGRQPIGGFFRGASAPVAAIIELIDSGAIKAKDAIDFLSQIQRTTGDVTKKISVEVKKANESADIAIANKDFTRQKYDALVAKYKKEGIVAPAVAAFDKLENGTVATQKIINDATQTIEQAKAQFNAGLISVDDYSKAVSTELGKLRIELESDKRAGTAAGLKNAALDQKAINALTSSLASDVRAGYDALSQAMEVAGRPLVGPDLIASIQKLASNPAIMGDKTQFLAVVKMLVAAERKQTSDIADREDNLKKRQDILDLASFSPTTAFLITYGRVISNSAPITKALSEAGAALTTGKGGITAILSDIAAMIDGGLTLDKAVRKILQKKLDDLRLIGAQVEGGAIRGKILGEISAIQKQLSGNLELPTIASGLDAKAVIQTPQQRADAITNAFKQNRETILSNFSFQEDVLKALGVDQGTDEKITRASRLLNDPALRGSKQAYEAAKKIIALDEGISKLSGEKQANAIKAINLLNAAGTTPLDEAKIEMIFAALRNQGSIFNNFLNEYLSIGKDMIDGITRAAAVLMNNGSSAIEAMTQALQQQLAKLQNSVGGLFGGGGGSATGSKIAELVKAIAAAQDDAKLRLIKFTPISIGSSDSGSKSASSLEQAYIGYLKALAGEDPVKLAKIDQQAAAKAILEATNKAEDLRAKTQEINADRAYEKAIQDVFSAQNELAITLAKQAGNTAEALRLGVEQAKSTLTFLKSQGAGESTLIKARIDVMNAQEQETAGMRNAKLGDLQFLSQMGDLSTQAYIAALKLILDQLDPTADKNLWRRISLQIKQLKGSAAELSTNLPSNFDLPTLYEVRRVNQATAMSGSGAPGLIPFSNDNRRVNITVNVSTGLDWEHAKNVISDALGVDSRSLTLSTNMY